MSYFASLLQDVQTPAGLQSVANIAPGATWSSAWVSTLGVAGIQPNLSVDKNCTVFVRQGSDGINADAGSDNRVIYAGEPDGWTVQATSAYVQVQIRNDDPVDATTSLILVTALCPIVEPLPRALSHHGNLKTSVEEMCSAEFDKCAWISPMNALKVTESARLVGHVLCDPLNALYWVQTVGGTGAITQTGGQVVLATGVLNGTARLATLRAARYIGSYSNVFRTQIRRPAAVGANTQRWGAFDANNGAFFSMDNVAGLSVVTRKAGVDTAVLTGSFNGNLGGKYVIDTNVHVYQIVYTNGTVYFLVGEELLHTVSASAAPWTDTMHLYGAIENNNGANINNNTLECRVLTVARLGKESTQPTSQRINALGTFVLKSSPGLLHAIIFGDMPTAAGASITLYDNTVAAGTVIANLVPRRPATTMQPQELDFHKLTFSTGLTVAVAGSASDVTVVFE